MFEEYWFQHGASSSIIISGWQRMSYFAQNKHVWFMEHELDHQIRALHQLVGNAVTEGRHIVVGTGSTQLFQATLYALTSHDQPAPTSVVSAAPFYSVCASSPLSAQPLLLLSEQFEHSRPPCNFGEFGAWIWCQAFTQSSDF